MCWAFVLLCCAGKVDGRSVVRVFPIGPRMRRGKNERVSTAGRHCHHLAAMEGSREVICVAGIRRAGEGRVGGEAPDTSWGVA